MAREPNRRLAAHAVLINDDVTIKGRILEGGKELDNMIAFKVEGPRRGSGRKLSSHSQAARTVGKREAQFAFVHASGHRDRLCSCHWKGFFPSGGSFVVVRVDL